MTFHTEVFHLLPTGLPPPQQMTISEIDNLLDDPLQRSSWEWGRDNTSVSPAASSTTAHPSLSTIGCIYPA
jgi:hypothetical protein